MLSSFYYYFYILPPKTITRNQKKRKINKMKEKGRKSLMEETSQGFISSKLLHNYYSI
jgi:hypothetical protein